MGLGRCLVGKDAYDAFWAASLEIAVGPIFFTSRSGGKVSPEVAGIYWVRPMWQRLRPLSTVTPASISLRVSRSFFGLLCPPGSRGAVTNTSRGLSSQGASPAGSDGE
jgi:hypothetical protein